MDKLKNDLDTSPFNIYVFNYNTYGCVIVYARDRREALIQLRLNTDRTVECEDIHEFVIHNLEEPLVLFENDGDT